MAKKNARGAGTIRQRKDGRWEARYTVGRDPGTGKQIQKSIYGKTQQEVRQKLQAVTSSIDTGTYIEPMHLTVGQWGDIWIKEYCGNVKAGTIKVYRSYLKNHIKPAIGHIKLQNLGGHAIQTFYNALSRGDTSTGNKITARTIEGIHNVLHSLLEQAVILGYLHNNPTRFCKIPKPENKEMNPLDEQQIIDFVKVIQGDRFERIFKLALFTGMRQSEIIGLSWDTVDFENGTITVKQQLPYISGECVLTTPKNGKPRTLTPAPSVMKMLRDQRHNQKEMRLFAGQAWNNKMNLVFTNEIGEHIRHDTVRNHLKRILESIGVEKVRFHDLRHTYAVASLQAGDSVKTVQENLGHHTAAFTLDRYAHVTDKMRRDSAERMEEYILSIGK